MKRILIFALLCVLLVSCGKEQKKEENNIEMETSQKSSMTFVDYDPGKELPEYKGVWGLDVANCNVYVARATEKYVWFSYDLSYYMRAEKKEDGKYHFYQHFNHIGEGYADVQGSEGILELKNGILYVAICRGPNHMEKLEKGKRMQEESERLVNVKTMDVFQYLDDYDKAYHYKEDNRLFYATLGKEPDGNRVSSFKISLFENVEYYYQYAHDYCFGSIDFTSTKKQCDQTWGQPVAFQEKKHGTVYTYQYQDYQVDVYFSTGGSIQNISLYLNSKEEAMKKYQIGDFVLQGSRVIRYKGAKNSIVTFPKEAVAVGAWSFQKSKLVKKIHVPKDLHLEPEAFRGCRAKLVTFEEGRKKIPRESFASFGTTKNGVQMTIRLPKSTRVIEQEAFRYGYEYGMNPLHLILNDGLKKIESMGVYGVEVDLPNSITKMEQAAYGSPVKKVYLPEGISGLEEGAIDFLHEDTCIGEPDENYVVYVPSSVDLQGKNIAMNGVVKRYEKE